MEGRSYWLLTALLVVFGFITGFSIGAPFFLLGLVMIVVGPFRRHALVFWPPIAAVVAFSIGYVLFVPLTCTATAAVGQESHVVCSSILGGPYAGTGLYNPPLQPALLTGIGIGIGAAILALAFLIVRDARSAR